MRGFLAGVVRKRLGLELESANVDGARVYRIAEGRAAFSWRPAGIVIRMTNVSSARRLPGRGGRTVEAEIAQLRDLGLEGIRARWRAAFRREPPAHLPKHLLFAMAAYRLQAEAMGDLDAETLRFLKQMDQTSSKAEAAPVAEQRRRQLSPGTVLTREWSGQHHRMMVLDEGFAWERGTYKSLSGIAKAITGTKWNGPRFFGLRDKTRQEKVKS